MTHYESVNEYLKDHPEAEEFREYLERQWHWDTNIRTALIQCQSGFCPGPYPGGFLLFRLLKFPSHAIKNGEPEYTIHVTDYDDGEIRREFRLKEVAIGVFDHLLEVDTIDLKVAGFDGY